MASFPAAVDAVAQEAPDGSCFCSPNAGSHTRDIRVAERCLQLEKEFQRQALHQIIGTSKQHNCNTKADTFPSECFIN